MDKVKCSKELYCQFLLTAQKEFSATTLADLKDNISHDKVTRWLRDTKLTPRLLWEEEYHRGLKQTVGVEYCQARNQRSQRTHIFCSLLAFVTLEVKRLKTGVSWYQSKRDIIQSTMRYYLEKPSISFNFS